MLKENILTDAAGRLGIQNSSTIRKAEEFLRIFQAKGSLKSLSDIGKTILCLDLACSHLGTDFDKESAVTLSGLKKSAYRTNLHTVETLLELDKTLTISELCVQLSCTVVKDLAEEIFNKYELNSKLKDLRHPQYVAVAVYTACKLKNVKFQKTQFIEISRLKPAQWKELTVEFEKFVSSFGIGSPRKRKKVDIKSTIDELANDIENKILIKEKDLEEEEIEEYEIWKKRILDEAYEKINGNDQ